MGHAVTADKPKSLRDPSGKQNTLTELVKENTARPVKNDARVLLWDIETAPMIVATFDLRPEFIPHENILHDWYMICSGWKWLDEDTVTVQAVSAKDHRDDGPIVRKLYRVLLEADVLVHQNGDRFDLPKFNVRAQAHGLKPLPPIPTVDTLKVARKHFAFSSNRLDALGRALGVGTKVETPKGLWLDCLNGDRAAILKMVEYNRGDVLLLEAVYLKLRPYARNHPNLALVGEDWPACPVCGSANVIKTRRTYRTRVNRYQLWECKDCGYLPRGTNKPGGILR